MLAFSNLANSISYTHPTRDYFTGRWADAPVPPSPAAPCLLWPGATPELGTTDRGEGLRVIADAVGRWKAEDARAIARRRFSAWTGAIASL